MMMFKTFNSRKVLTCQVVYLVLFGWTITASAQANLKVTKVGLLNQLGLQIDEAGNDYDGALSSDQEAVLIDVFQHLSQQDLYAYPWKILVRKINFQWQEQLSVWVRRTGDGKNVFPGINGGKNFLKVSDFNQLLFSGFGPHQSIPLQYQIRGISVTLPAKNYQSTIILTITAN